MKNYLLAMLAALVLSSLISGMSPQEPQPVPVGVSGVQESAAGTQRPEEGVGDFKYSDQSRVNGMVTRVGEKGERNGDFPLGSNF